MSQSEKLSCFHALNVPGQQMHVCISIDYTVHRHVDTLSFESFRNEVPVSKKQGFMLVAGERRVLEMRVASTGQKFRWVKKCQAHQKIIQDIHLA